MYKRMFPSCSNEEEDWEDHRNYPTRYTTMQDIQASYEVPSELNESTRKVKKLEPSSSSRLWCKRHRAFLPPSSMFRADSNNPTPLLSSLQTTKQRLMLDKLLSHPKVDVTAKDEVEGMTMLHYAVAVMILINN